MSVNPEALQKLLLEMDQQLQQNKAELQMVQVQLDRKTVDSKVADVTLKELENGSGGDRIWEGVGKIFLASPIDDYKKRLKEDQKTLEEQNRALKIKKDYLATSLEKTVSSMNAIITGKRPE